MLTNEAEEGDAGNGSRKRPRLSSPHSSEFLTLSDEECIETVHGRVGQQGNSEESVGDFVGAGSTRWVAKDFLSLASSDSPIAAASDRNDEQKMPRLVTTQSGNPGGLSPSMLPSVLDLLAGNGRLSDNDMLMVRMDSSGVVKEWNDAAVEMIGYSREETFNKALIDNFVIPEIRPHIQKIFEDGMQGRSYKFIMEQRTKGGDPIFLLVNTSPVRDPIDCDKVVGLVGYARDVTKEAKYDMSVRALCSDHQMLIERANTPVFGVNHLMQTCEWNESSVAATGFTSRDVVGKPFVETLVAHHSQQSVKNVLDLALEKGKQANNYEIIVRTKGRQEVRIWVVNISPRFDPRGEVFGAIGVARDVTEDRKLKKQLSMMEAASKEELASERGVTAYFAHELRNPLHAIDSALQSLPDDMSDTTKNLVNAMKLCTGFMSSVMNNLLDVRKMEEGKMILASEPMSISCLLREVHDMLAPSVQKGVEFVVECRTKGRDWVIGDFRRLEQVLTNIATNSIKYTETGRITLRASWEDDSMKLECVDSGPGIPKEVQEQIFEKFIQRGSAPGTGLGLTIAKNVVELCKGTIRFDSDPTLRPGTTCVILLPLVSCEAQSRARREDMVQCIDSDISFLVIDDIALNRTILSQRLKKCIAPNATIHEACNGEEGMRMCQTQKFDVIIVDYNMRESGGVMVGTDVVVAMRRQGICSIIIGCSGTDSDEAYEEAGCDLVWGKPIPSNSAVVKQLSKLLNQKVRAAN